MARKLAQAGTLDVERNPPLHELIEFAKPLSNLQDISRTIQAFIKDFGGGNGIVRRVRAWS